MEKVEIMVKDKPLTLIFKMSLPIMISMLVQSLYNIVDSIFVARISNDALSAVSLVFPLQNLALAIAVGFGVGICAQISINLGSKRFKEANISATLGIFFALVHAAVFTILGLLIARPFLSLFTNDPKIMQMAMTYGNIVIGFSFAQILQITFEKIFQASGRMVEQMMLLGIGCIINIILDPILIFGLFNFPRLGVAGAAIATIIGQIVALIAYALVYFKNNGGITINKQHFVFDSYLIKRMYGVGIPSSIMIALPSVLVSILNAILLQFSTIYVAVLGLYFKLQSFIYLPAGGLIQGIRPLISYNYGAKRNDRVKEFIRLSLIITCILMILGTLACLLYPQAILTIFNDDPQLLSYGSDALRIISLGFIVSTIPTVYAGVFEALGDGRSSLIISLIRQFIVLIPVSFALSFVFKANGVFMAFPIAEVCGAIMALYLNHKLIKKILV